MSQPPYLNLPLAHPSWGPVHAAFASLGTSPTIDDLAGPTPPSSAPVDPFASEFFTWSENGSGDAFHAPEAVASDFDFNPLPPPAVDDPFASASSSFSYDLESFLRMNQASSFDPVGNPIDPPADVEQEEPSPVAPLSSPHAPVPEKSLCDKCIASGLESDCARIPGRKRCERCMVQKKRCSRVAGEVVFRWSWGVVADRSFVVSF